MRLGRSTAGGMVGALAAFTIVLLARWLLGEDSDLFPLLTGIPFYGAEGPALIGAIAVELLIGGAIAPLYALIFQRATLRAGWRIGAVLGLVHAGVAGLVIGFLPLLQSDPSPWTVPGAFLSFQGWGMGLALVFSHLAYGAIVGASYRLATRRAGQLTAVYWRETYPGRRQP
jgi:hypothetical protein